MCMYLKPINCFINNKSCDVPVTTVSVGDVSFMEDCVLSQVHGCQSNSCMKSSHTPDSPWAGAEERCGVPRKESPLL